MKAINKQHFHVVLFILLYKALNFKSVDEALVGDTKWKLLSHIVLMWFF